MAGGTGGRDGGEVARDSRRAMRDRNFNLDTELVFMGLAVADEGFWNY